MSLYLGPGSTSMPTSTVDTFMLSSMSWPYMTGLAWPKQGLQSWCLANDTGPGLTRRLLLLQPCPNSGRSPFLV